MSDFSVFTLRSVVVEECVGRGCKEPEKSLCTDFWSHSNKAVQRHAGMKALFLCLQIFSRPACCELLSFCKDCTLFNNKRYKYNHLKKKKKKRNLIQPVFHYTETKPLCNLELVHHIQFWWGFVQAVKFH